MLDPDTSEPTDILTEQARDFCQKTGSKATKVSEIVATRDQAIYQAIQEGIDKVNMNATNRVHCIQKWIVLPRDFSISGGELGKIYWFPLMSTHSKEAADLRVFKYSFVCQILGSATRGKGKSP